MINVVDKRLIPVRGEGFAVCGGVTELDGLIPAGGGW